MHSSENKESHTKKASCKDECYDVPPLENGIKINADLKKKLCGVSTVLEQRHLKEPCSPPDLGELFGDESSDSDVELLEDTKV